MSLDDFFGLDGRVVIVSGASGGGIGTAVARRIAEAGAHVIAVGRSAEKLGIDIAPLAAQGLPITPVAADAATDDGIATVLDHAGRADGQLYGLVNIAGGAAPATWMPATRVTRADWRALLEWNLETMFFFSQGRHRRARLHRHAEGDRQHARRPGRAARGHRRDLRVPGRRGGELHHRAGDRRQRRP